jgi:enoyl-CoA hydratase/carnithine racemase
MTKESLGRLDVEDRGSLLIARLDGGPLAQLGPGLVAALTALVGRVESDPAIDAVVLTGTHPDPSAAVSAGFAVDPHRGRSASTRASSASRA